MNDQNKFGESIDCNNRSKFPLQIKNSKQHQSRSGHWFDEDEAVWKLDKDNCVYIDRFRAQLSEQTLYGFISTLAHYAKTMSGSHARNIADRCYAMLAEMGATSISTVVLINYRSSLDRANEWKMGTIRGFLLKWYELGYPGVGEDVVDLLNGWMLRGNIKGDAVKRLDPNEGPLSDNELLAFNEGVARSYEQKKINLGEMALCLLISHTGRRPKQIAHTKICDLDRTKVNKKNEAMFLIHIPRAKQRNEVFRDSFKTFAMTEDLWTVLSSQREEAIASVERALGYQLQDSDRMRLPLFPDVSSLKAVTSVVMLRSTLETDELHIKAIAVTAALKNVVKVGQVVSERTNELIKLSAKRFRYTTGTRAAREGLGKMVIAELLDHTDIQNVDVYTKNVPGYMKALNKAMALQLAPFAQAFQGVLVDHETDAKRGNDRSSRIKFKGQDTATCGQYGFCGANAPIPCYTCQHFQPWLEGPHEQVLAELIAEREQVTHLTGDEAMAAVNDRTILAVVNVIQRCQMRRSELEKETGRCSNG